MKLNLLIEIILVCTLFSSCTLELKEQDNNYHMKYNSRNVVQKYYTDSILYDALNPSNYVDLFFLSRQAAQKGDYKKSLFYLENSIQKGWVDYDFILSEPILSKVLGKNKENHEIINTERKNSMFKKELDSTLKIIYHKDQVYRKIISDSLIPLYGDTSSIVMQEYSKQMKNDSENIKAINNYFFETGIPGTSVISKTSIEGIFHVLQHSNYFNQENYYSQLIRLAYIGDLELSFLAKYADRMKLRKNNHQMFGTQICCDFGDVLPECCICKIENPIGVDLRRVDFGLDSLENFMKKEHIDCIK